MTMSTTRMSEQDHEEAMYLLHSLERENATLKDELDASIATTTNPPPTTPPPGIIASATTTSRDDALIAALKEQSATQTTQITKLLAPLSAGGGGNGRGDIGRGRCDGRLGRGDVGRGRGDGNTNPKHKYCKSCKRVVTHEAAECYQLESNAATCPHWWKKEVHGIFLHAPVTAAGKKIVTVKTDNIIRKFFIPPQPR